MKNSSFDLQKEMKKSIKILAFWVISLAVITTFIVFYIFNIHFQPIY